MKNNNVKLFGLMLMVLVIFFGIFLVSKNADNRNYASERQPAGNYCNMDSQCESFKCINHICAKGGCRSNSQCGKGEVCSSGKCVKVVKKGR